MYNMYMYMYMYRVKGPDEKVPTFRTLGALMAPYRIAMRSP